MPVELRRRDHRQGQRARHQPATCWSAANYPVVARNAVADGARRRASPTRRRCKRRSASCVSDGSRASSARDGRRQPLGHRHHPTVTLLAAGDIDSANKGQIDLARARGQAQGLRPAGRLARPAAGSRATSPRRSTGACSPSAPPAAPETAGLGVALVGSLYMMLIVLVLRAADRRRRLDLSRGVRAEEPLHRPHRGQHQQPRGRALDRLRPARPRGVHQLLRPAALGARSSAAWC